MTDILATDPTAAFVGFAVYMNTMKTYRERLLWAMKEAGITSQSELARRVDVRPQSIQHLVDPKKNAQGSAHTAKIAEVLKVSPKWLATGEGSPRVILIDESHHSYRQVSNLLVMSAEEHAAMGKMAFTGTPAATQDMDRVRVKSFGKLVKELSEMAKKYSERTRDRLAMDVAYMIKHGPSDSEASAIDALLAELEADAVVPIIQHTSEGVPMVQGSMYFMKHEPTYQSRSNDIADLTITIQNQTSNRSGQGVTTLLTSNSEKELWKKTSNRDHTNLSETAEAPEIRITTKPKRMNLRGTVRRNK